MTGQSRGRSLDTGALRVEELDRGREDTRRYEPPRVERVLTPAELDQEFLYAGQFDGTPIATDS